MGLWWKIRVVEIKAALSPKNCPLHTSCTQKNVHQTLSLSLFNFSWNPCYSTRIQVKSIFNFAEEKGRFFIKQIEIIQSQRYFNLFNILSAYREFILPLFFIFLTSWYYDIKKKIRSEYKFYCRNLFKCGTTSKYHFSFI